MSKVFYITGSSSGLGEDLVRNLSSRGHQVIATARSITKIEHLKQLSNVRVQQLDISDSTETLKQKVDEAISFFGRIDVLVNNAGYGQSGCFEEVSMDEIRKQFETNVFGTVNLTQVFLPYFRSTATESKICTVTSGAGTVAFPTSTAYSASKFALEGFFENLDAELRASQIPVQVLIVAPGVFKTNFVDNMVKPDAEIGAYADLKHKINTFLQGISESGGDCSIGAKLIADALLGEGFAEGKTVPLRLPIGSDSVAQLVGKYRRELEVTEAWKPFAAESDAK
ncbi:hypothetical protein E3P99_03422 [Wallemia hederae]|uniref:Uncharacterized protein n=1 Tax=Wallemia hederae TaxID=1540922 RepID=A0A4T0FGA3_9BASI|nr:hypothetical protein E3P99_03422 [Wallemia hederae]